VTPSLPDLAALLPSWQLALKAERKSPSTIASYAEGVIGFIGWCKSTGTGQELTKSNVTAFTAALLDDGAQPATARSRHMALRRYAAWLADEGEIDANPLLGVKPPKMDTKVTEALSDDQLRAMIKACQGKEFLDRRDEAIVRFMAETAVRSGELLGMALPGDIDLAAGTAIVRRGKGGKGRTVPYGPQTASAVDRYMRSRLGCWPTTAWPADPQAGGRATNARRRDGADQHPRVGETSPNDARTDVHTAPAA
jgi:site-specific recombinase XerC